MKGNNKKIMQKNPDMLKEYDFSNGIQEKYAKEYVKGSNVVVIEPDVAEFFPYHASVNQTLGSFADISKIKLQDKKTVHQLEKGTVCFNTYSVSHRVHEVHNKSHQV